MYQMTAQGDIEWVMIGSRKYISRESLMGFIKVNTQGVLRRPLKLQLTRVVWAAVRPCLPGGCRPDRAQAAAICHQPTAPPAPTDEICERPRVAMDWIYGPRIRLTISNINVLVTLGGLT